MSQGAGVLRESSLPGQKLFRRGKVRDVYDLGDHLLFVATDRISAFDVVLPTGIADKGRVLSGLSAFWFERTRGIVPNHLVTSDPARYPKALAPHRAALAGRSMLVRKAEVFPVECVVRGYLAGSGWKEYRATGRVCGVLLPGGLRDGDRLPEPIFTPATKAEKGHDENIPIERMEQIVGRDAAAQLRRVSLDLYGFARGYARERGLILADTKFEFGRIEGEIVLVDETLTPDSSRYWPADRWKPGGAQPSFDKQYVRDYLDSLKWDHTPPAPELPPEVVEKTREKYLAAYKILTGRDLA